MGWAPGGWAAIAAWFQNVRCEIGCPPLSRLPRVFQNETWQIAPKRSKLPPNRGIRRIQPMARPRTYERAEVLRRASDLFARKGFEGSHLQELVEVTGL